MKAARGAALSFSESALGKLIAKTAGITLACILALALILFGVFTVFFPSVMFRLTDLCGMDKICTQYAVSVYSRSNKIEDLANVVERGYASESWQIVSDYGTRLTARADFEEFCDLRDEAEEDGARIPGGYAQYIAGAVAVAHYRLGEEEEALSAAFEKNRRSFEENNAVVTLSMTVIAEGDIGFAAEIYEELCGLSGSVNFDVEADVRNYETLLHILEEFCADGAA